MAFRRIQIIVSSQRFFYSLLGNFATQTAFFVYLFIFSLARSAESAESFLFRLGLALRSALRVANFQIKKDNIKRKPLGPGYHFDRRDAKTFYGYEHPLLYPYVSFIISNILFYT